jgi:hypothetical protein
MTTLSIQSNETIYGEGDYSYTVSKSRFGLYTSILCSGGRMVSGSTLDGVVAVTNDIHIPVLRGTFDGYTSQSRTSVVDGKL